MEEEYFRDKNTPDEKISSWDCNPREYVVDRFLSMYENM